MSTRTLAEYIRALTSATAYSQEDIARHADLSLRTVANVAAGRSCSQDTADRIANAILHFTMEAHHAVYELLRDLTSSEFMNTPEGQ